MKQCEFFLVQYSPFPWGDVRVPVGLILVDEEGALIKHGTLQDFRRLRCLEPAADLELLRLIPSWVEELSYQVTDSEHVSTFRQTLVRMAGSGLGRLQISAPQGVETQAPEAEFEHLFEEHVAAPRQLAQQPRSARVGSRRWIQARLRDGLEQYGLWDRLQHGVSVERFTAPGDAFRIDHMYPSNGMTSGAVNGNTKYIHALSLQQDWNQAKVLSYTFGRIQQRGRAELTAIVGDTTHGLAMAESCRKILAEADIAVQPLAGLDAFLKKLEKEVSTGG